MSWDSIFPNEGQQVQILLISDNGANSQPATAAIKALGFATCAELPIEAAQGWLQGNDRADAVVVEMGYGQPQSSNLLAMIDDYSSRHQLPIVVAAPLETIDAVHSVLISKTAHLLCNPTLEDRIATMATVLSPKSQMLHDIGTDIDTVRLRRLADEVSRIARALSTLSATERPNRGFAAQAVSDVQLGFRTEPLTEVPTENALTSEDVRKILKLRRLRGQFFDSSLFADPAWDMLLDLMAARLERTQVAVSSLCIAAAVPPTTALRWIKAMSDHALFERCADPDDGRRIFIQLSDMAMVAMGHYFAAVRRIGGVMI